MTMGVLAIWNDCAAGKEAAYEHWYQTEHLFERVGIDGFRSVRRFEGELETPRFLTTYEVDSPGVLNASAYLERLNNPTERTREMMSDAFENMTRTACRREPVEGRQSGGIAITARFKDEIDAGLLQTIAGDIWNPSNVARIEIWTAESSEFLSEEERLRGGDDRISACLYVEVLRQTDTARIVKTIETRFPQATVGTYRFLCRLDHRGLDR